MCLAARARLPDDARPDERLDVSTPIPELRETVARDPDFAPISGVKRFLYFRALARARETVKDRENLRFLRTKVFGLACRILDAIGEDLASRAMLDDPRDVYFLTLQELEGLVDAALLTQDLRGLVAIRKRERERFLAADPDERFVTRGAPYARNALRAPRPPPRILPD